jgi:hypothetical protein
MARHQFCRDIAIASGEPIEGTGALRAEMLLVRWPRAKWGSADRGHGMSQALAAALARAGVFTPYVTFIDRSGKTDTLPQLLFFPQNIAVSSPDEAMLIEAIDTWIDGGPIAGTPEPRVTILCCTDSQTDACCARFGQATYTALVAHADERVFNVVQSSHIGGCRFAASLAIAGRRERYGRLDAGQVPEFLSAIATGRPYLPAFKGRAELAEPEQVAELAALRWAARAGHEGPIVVLSPASGDRLRRYNASVAGTRLLITLEARDFQVYGHCDAVPTGKPLLRQRWLVSAVVEA